MIGVMSAPIVVGYDPHGADDAPVHFGIAAARFTGAPLIIAAISGGAPAIDRLADGELPAELDADAYAALDGLRSRLRGEPGIDADVRLVEAASAARGMHLALEDEGAGLAVVGTTSRGAVGRTVVGSTAERVIHGAPCPVAVVPHGFAGGELRTVGVAYTESEEGEEALRSGVALAAAGRAALRVFTVLREEMGTVPAQMPGQRAARTLPGEIASQHHVRARETIDAALAEAGGQVEAEIDLLYGDPAETLLGVTQSLDLLVMGSRAYGPRRAVLLGGVARRVTATAACPVLVLPRGAEHPLRELLRAQPAV
jgi:nucleotide-binding universal stress UspA family protein